MIFPRNNDDELLGRRSGPVGGLLLLLLFLFGGGAAATGILSQRDGGAEGEAEAKRHDDKLLHFLVISFESTMVSSVSDEVFVS
jgi:hypothetical protein